MNQKFSEQLSEMRITNAKEAARLTEQLVKKKTFFAVNQAKLASVRSKRYLSPDKSDKYVPPDRKSVRSDEVDPERTYANNWLKSLNQTESKSQKQGLNLEI